LTEKEFINFWINKILSGGIKNLPDDFKDLKEFEEINLPQKSLLIGTELFGRIEIITADGTFFLQADDYNYAKYLVYASRQRTCKIKVPKNKNEIKTLVSDYEKYLDSFLVLLNSEYGKLFPERNPSFAVNEIFRAINLVRY
jgi:hypothetical protein